MDGFDEKNYGEKSSGFTETVRTFDAFRMSPVSIHPSLIESN